jgi:hypothetical protein
MGMLGMETYWAHFENVNKIQEHAKEQNPYTKKSSLHPLPQTLKKQKLGMLYS